MLTAAPNHALMEQALRTVADQQTTLEDIKKIIEERHNTLYQDLLQMKQTWGEPLPGQVPNLARRPKRIPHPVGATRAQARCQKIHPRLHDMQQMRILHFGSPVMTKLKSVLACFPQASQVTRCSTRQIQEHSTSSD